MGNKIIDLQNSDTWKVQSINTINFISLTDAEKKECVMHSRSENIEFTSYNDANEVVNEFFESLRNLETSMRRSVFIFGSVQIMYYKCCEENVRRGDSYIDSPDWIKKKKQQ